MRRHTKWLLPVAIGFLVSACTGYSPRSSATTTTPESTATIAQVTGQRLDHDLSLLGGRYQLTPARPTDEPAVSADEAAARVPNYEGDQSGSPRVLLARVTVPAYGPGLIVNRLSWVVWYQGVNLRAYDRGPGPGVPHPNTIELGDVVVPIDAVTGDVLLTSMGASTGDVAKTTASAPSIGVTLTPPPPGQRAISVSEAARHVAAVFGAGLVATMTPQLAILNDSVMGEMQEDGTVKLDYVDRPVWAFIASLPCDNLPALGAIGAKTSSAPAGSQCIEVLMADAVTGQYLMGYSNSAELPMG